MLWYYGFVIFQFCSARLMKRKKNKMPMAAFNVMCYHSYRCHCNVLQAHRNHCCMLWSPLAHAQWFPSFNFPFFSLFSFFFSLFSFFFCLLPFFLPPSSKCRQGALCTPAPCYATVTTPSLYKCVNSFAFMPVKQCYHIQQLTVNSHCTTCFIHEKVSKTPAVYESHLCWSPRHKCLRTHLIKLTTYELSTKWAM